MEVMSVNRITDKRQRARLIRLQRMQAARILANNYSVFEPSTCEKGVVMFGKDCEPVSIHKDAAKALGLYEHKWSITCCIMCREKNGKNKLIAHQVDIETQCRHSDIRSAVADIHWELAQEYKYQDTILTLGWIAGSFGNSPSEEDAYKIFDRLGVWGDLIAEWESVD